MSNVPLSTLPKRHHWGAEPPPLGAHLAGSHTQFPSQRTHSEVGWPQVLQEPQPPLPPGAVVGVGVDAGAGVAGLLMVQEPVQ